MTPEQQLTLLVEKGKTKEIIPFLQACTTEERKSLVAPLKKLAKFYNEFIQNGNSWSSRGSVNQHEVLSCAYFACFDRKDFERLGARWSIERKFLEKFLSWYCPSWFGAYINGFASQEFIPAGLDYLYIMELADRGFLQPAPELLAKLLVPLVYEWEERKHLFLPEKLKQHPLALTEHIWYLFQFETNVHNSNYRVADNDKQSVYGWKKTFHLYVENGALPRQRVLQETLLASNRNFNKNASGWFADLFQSLTPTPDEMIVLQSEIFILFSSPHSKVVNVALQACKSIVDRKDFNAIGFLEHTTVLLASPTKSVVSTTLQLLDTLAKKHKDQRQEIARQSTAALMHKEETLQLKAAKLIEKWGDASSVALSDLVAMYSATLFSKPKEVLSAFLHSAEVPINEAATTEPTVADLSLQAPLPEVNSVDELVFLAAQAFDNNQPWHLDIFPAALIELHEKIKAEDVVKFEPAVQRALKLFFGDWRSTQGMLDHMLASFFLNYILILVRKYPATTSTIFSLFKSFMYKNEANKKIWDEHGAASIFFDPDATNAGDVYVPHRKLLGAVLQAISFGSNLPLICAPTHQPCFIDPLVLIERLRLHQLESEDPDDTDLQIALSRCWLQADDEVLVAARQQLSGELQRLILFLLTPDAAPQGPFVMEAAWMTAALAKAPHKVYPQLAGLTYSQRPRQRYTGQYAWNCTIEEYTYPTYEWNGGDYKQVTVQAKRKRVLIDFKSADAEDRKEVSGFRKWVDKIAGKKEQKASVPSPLLYDYRRIKKEWLSVEDRDIRRIYSLTPHNPEPLMAVVYAQCFSYSSFSGETDKRMVTEMLKAYHEAPVALAEMGHLFIASSLICSDKTAAAYAAEIWLQGVRLRQLDGLLLGTILGKLEAIEFAPLKRLTDLLLSHLVGVSPACNKAVEITLAAMLKNLPAVPIKGLKKLLEIYLELVTLNGNEVDAVIEKKIKSWKESKVVSQKIN